MPSLTTGLTAVMQLYYDRMFLDRAKAFLVHDYGAQVKRLPRNSGKSIVWSRFTPLALATTALTEGTDNPTQVEMTAANVSTTVALYGNFTRVTDLFKLTSLDEGLAEHVSVMAQNAGETFDALIRNEMATGGTAQIVGAKALTAVAATDVITGAEIRKAVKTLKANKAQKFEDGYFRGIIDQNVAYDLFADSEWVNMRQYTNTDDLKAGIIGRIHGVQFKETNQGATVASTISVAITSIFGKNAYGTVSLEGQEGSRIIVKNPGEQDTSNPLNIFSTVGWRGYFAAKVLNSTWIINLKTGYTGAV